MDSESREMIAEFEQACPLFIVGAQRSGTTLLRTILHSHPDISIGYECAFYKILSGKYYRNGSINDRLEAFLDDLFQVRRFDFWEIDRALLRANLAAHPGELAYAQAVLIVADTYRQAHKPGAKQIGFKNPNGILHLPFIFELFPKARVLHIMRDVRGVFASRKKKSNKYSGYHAAATLHEVMRGHRQALKARDHYRSDPRVHVLRYEDLVTKTEEVIRRVFEWLGTPMDDSVLNYHRLNTQNGLTPERELWQHGKTREAPDSSRIDAYRQELDPSELAALDLMSGRWSRPSVDGGPGNKLYQGIPLAIQSQVIGFNERMGKLVNLVGRLKADDST